MSLEQHPNSHSSRGTWSSSWFAQYASRINWMLFFGLLMVALVALVAVLGPRLAPHDPLQENAIIRVGDEWKIPEFKAFTPGFLLGSDEFGRDLLSRLLWAVRPTMTMVLIVACVRLSLGMIIGLGAGWFGGWLGRILDTVIGLALAVPVLMVALGAIAAVGIEMGVWAFIIGLSINGWVETARLVREQTRLVKTQLYVEAARALGSSDAQVIWRHVVRQIMPMVWMLFAFEISGTLMVAAALGFLGYYIGGDVWVVITDSAARRTSGTPELGQMLATSWTRTDEPWGMIAVGSVVFFTVLGFNLVGRALRRRLRLKRMPRHTLWGRAQEALHHRVTDPVGRWMEERVRLPLRRQTQRRGGYLALCGLLIVVTCGLIVGRMLVRKSSETPLLETGPAVGQLWSAQRRDAQGTLWSQTTGPLEPVVQWVFTDPEGFSGGPAVSDDGTVYLTSKQGVLYALTPGGQVRWQVQLPDPAVGTPALGAEGHIYVTDKAGNLSAFSPAGERQWRFQPEGDGAATSGPIVDLDGVIYFMMRGTVVQAVSSTGEGLWETQALYNPIYSPPRLSADGEWLFVKNAVLNAGNGSVQEWDTPVEVDRYFTGADRQNYLRVGNTVYRWRLSAANDTQGQPKGIETTHSATWAYRQFTVRAAGGPTDVGVTPDQMVWLLYASNKEDTRIVRVNKSGRTVGNTHLAQRNTEVIAVDRDAILYACGWGRLLSLECLALDADSEDPIWQVSFDQGSQLDEIALAPVSSLDITNPRISGGALVPGRLYVALEDGFLFALGEREAGQAMEQDVESVQETTTPLGPMTEEIEWTFEDPVGFSSKPVVASTGTLYISSREGTFYALAPSGDVSWEVALPAAPVGPPALGANGEIYQADIAGNLSAFAPDGALLWRFRPPESKRPTVGPVVAPNGTIYYDVGGIIQAVSPDGEGLWQTKFRTFRAYTPLQVDASGELLFFADDVISVPDQVLLELESPVEVDRFFPGADGNNYLRSRHTVMQWQRSGSRLEIGKKAQWSYTGIVYAEGAPAQAGVTREGVIWLHYTAEFGATTIVWVDLEGQVLGIVYDDFRDSQIVTVLDQTETVYACGYKDKGISRTSSFPQCKAFVPGSKEPIWQVEIGERTEKISGGALAPGRLYLATGEGVLYAIGEGGPEP